MFVAGGFLLHKHDASLEFLVFYIYTVIIDLFLELKIISTIELI